MPKGLKKIGILGGMGPEATADLFRWIIWLTPATNDQENVPVVIHNNPQIPSRVEAIMNNGPSPLPVMRKMVKELETLNCNFVSIPCNAAHYYLPDLNKNSNIPIINMIEKTADYINENFPNIKKVGILAP
ncbi:amino acid racemase [candidate division WWE3 bacterium]|jgi:aspartate racemase|nr:amino acid racemase [candidate division WWE3 bacterium]MBT7349382.1 amino acid racemase [candidate division WWE3 bacterium]